MTDRHDSPEAPEPTPGGAGASEPDTAGSGGPDRRPWIVVGVLALVVLVLGVWLWASSDDDGDDVAGTGDTTDTTESTTESESTDTTSTTESESTGTTDTTLPDEDPGGITVPEGASTSPVSVPPPAMEPTGLVAVRTARHEGFDRVVFEFDGALPGYEVAYSDPPVREDGSGNEVAVDGDYVVTVRMAPASGVRFTADGYEEVYTGPDRIPGAGATVTEVVEAGDFEGQTTWAVGLADRVDFAVATLSSPSRLVLDFVNH